MTNGRVAARGRVGTTATDYSSDTLPHTWRDIFLQSDTFESLRVLHRPLLDAVLGAKRHYYNAEAQKLYSDHSRKELERDPLASGRSQALWALALSDLYSTLGYHGQAEALCRALIDTPKFNPGRFFAATALVFVGHYSQMRRQYGYAFHRYHEAYLLWKGQNFPHCIAITMARIGYVQMLRGEYTSALSWIDDASRIAARSTALEVPAYCALTKIAIQTYIGDLRSAREGVARYTDSDASCSLLAGTPYETLIVSDVTLAGRRHLEEVILQLVTLYDQLASLERHEHLLDLAVRIGAFANYTGEFEVAHFYLTDRLQTDLLVPFGLYLFQQLFESLATALTGTGKMALAERARALIGQYQKYTIPDFLLTLTALTTWHQDERELYAFLREVRGRMPRYVSIDTLRVDLDSGAIITGNDFKEIGKLERGALLVFNVLAENRGKPVTKYQLLHTLYPTIEVFAEGTRSESYYISLLRNRFRELCGHPIIEAAAKRGSGWLIPSD